MAGDLPVKFGGLSGAGTIENGGAASKWLYLTNPNDTTFSGTLRDNPTTPQSASVSSNAAPARST